MSAVELARGIAAERMATMAMTTATTSTSAMTKTTTTPTLTTTIHYEAVDFLHHEFGQRRRHNDDDDANDDDNDDVDRDRPFDILLDKGTFDAISLAPATREKEERNGDEEDANSDSHSDSRSDSDSVAELSAEQKYKLRDQGAIQKYVRAVVRLMLLGRPRLGRPRQQQEQPQEQQPPPPPPPVLLLITSCNWTEPELVHFFRSEAAGESGSSQLGVCRASGFALFDPTPFPSAPPPTHVYTHMHATHAYTPPPSHQSSLARPPSRLPVRWPRRSDHHHHRTPAARPRWRFVLPVADQLAG